jgi:Molybdopterin converting factor, large subunit
MIDEWIKEIKQHPQGELVGMILVHNGIVRATTRQGKPVKGMKLSYNAEKLKDAVREIKKRDGIVEVKVWINEGELKVGDDIMKVLVAGRIRPEVFPALQELVGKIKKEVVHEEEIF